MPDNAILPKAGPAAGRMPASGRDGRGIESLKSAPDKRECFRLIHGAGTLDHIVAHSVQVCRVAMLIADGLREEVPTLRRDMVRAGALLHDITKTRSLTTGERHAESGGRYLSEKGFPAVGDIVRQHVRLDEFLRSGPVTEAEIVNYADKRVLHDRISPLKGRMDYILERYGRTPELRDRLGVIWEETLSLEEKLFHSLPFPPSAVAQRLPDEGLAREMKAYARTILTY